MKLLLEVIGIVAFVNTVTVFHYLYRSTRRSKPQESEEM